MIRWIAVVLLGILAGAWEVAAHPFLPLPFVVRPLLPLAILVLIASGRPKALALAIPGALLIDLYAPAIPDLATLRYVGIIVLLDVLSRHFLTNRSLYSAVTLGVIGRLTERASAWLIAGLVNLFQKTSNGWSSEPNLIAVMVWDAALIAIGFLLIAFLTKRFLLMATPSGSKGPKTWYGR